MERKKFRAAVFPSNGIGRTQIKICRSPHPGTTSCSLTLRCRISSSGSIYDILCERWANVIKKYTHIFTFVDFCLFDFPDSFFLSFSNLLLQFLSTASASPQIDRLARFLPSAVIIKCVNGGGEHEPWWLFWWAMWARGVPATEGNSGRTLTVVPFYRDSWSIEMRGKRKSEKIEVESVAPCTRRCDGICFEHSKCSLLEFPLPAFPVCDEIRQTLELQEHIPTPRNIAFHKDFVSSSNVVVVVVVVAVVAFHKCVMIRLGARSNRKMRTNKQTHKEYVYEKKYRCRFRRCSFIRFTFFGCIFNDAVRQPASCVGSRGADAGRGAACCHQPCAL